MEVVERLAGPLIAAGELPGERQEAPDQLGACLLVAAMGALQQRAVRAGAGHAGFDLGRVRPCAHRSVFEMHQGQNSLSAEGRAGRLGR